MSASGGMFISFEGNEGSGKSTQISLLADRLQAAGRSVIALREPGGTGLGELLRDILKTPKKDVFIDPIAELLLMNASRAQLVRQIIKPALEQGTVVLVDRFFDSTLVYQGFGRGLDSDSVQKTIDVAVGDCLPDLTFLLNVPVAVSEARRASRAVDQAEVTDRFEASERAFFERVEQGYQTIAQRFPQRVKTVDATRPIETVHQSIWDSLPDTLKLDA